MDQIRQAAIKALIYGDIFNYPLTALQIWEYAISSVPFSQQQLLKILPSLHKNVSLKNSFYFFSGKDTVANSRLSNQEINKKKLHIAQKISLVLSYIPTILFIGVSGSVAMDNAQKDDDIDLFFIVKPGSIWVSRLLVALLLQFTGRRRKKRAADVTDTICANMFLSHDLLAFPPQQQNLYLAHEIAQVLPLFSLENTYEKFIYQNRWIQKFLANWQKKTVLISHQSHIRDMISTLLIWVDSCAKGLQLAYMNKNRTSEIVTDSMIAFYPSDRAVQVLDSFSKKSKEYDI